MMPLASHGRVLDAVLVSDDGMNGGTVSMWVESASWAGMSRDAGPYVEAIGFYGNALHVIAQLRQLVGQERAYGAFHAGGGFDVDEFASEGKTSIWKKYTISPL